MLAQILVRDDSAANWSTSNPTLANGEPGFDTTNKILKIGDGSTAWSSLPAYYRAGGSAVALADGGTGASLTDPNADRILFWDDSAGVVTWLSLDGLEISGTTLKKVNRVASTASTTSWTVDAGATDVAIQTALAGALTINAPSNAPSVPQTLTIRIEDNGTARAITWDSVFRAIGITLPATTVVGKLLYATCMYNPTDTKWDVLAVGQEA